MDLRAAVAFEPGNPLKVTTVQLEGRRLARYWWRSRRPGFAIPTNSRSRVLIRRVFSRQSWGTKGAGVVVDVGPAVTSVTKGDHVIPLYTPECGACYSCRSGRTNLCTAIRATQGRC